MRLSGKFYYEDIEGLRTELHEEFESNFGKILGGNYIELRPGSIIVGVHSSWELFKKPFKDIKGTFKGNVDTVIVEHGGSGCLLYSVRSTQ